MSSLRSRIVLGTIVATSTVVLVSAGAAWFAVRLAMLQEADRRLDGVLAMYLVPPRDPGGPRITGQRRDVPGVPGDGRRQNLPQPGPWPDDRLPDRRTGDQPGRTPGPRQDDGRLPRDEPGEWPGEPRRPDGRTGPRDDRQERWRELPDRQGPDRPPGPDRQFPDRQFPDRQPGSDQLGPDRVDAPFRVPRDGRQPQFPTADQPGPPPLPREPGPLPRFPLPREDRGELVQVVASSDGAVLLRSPALKDGEDLAASAPPGWDGRPHTAVLAGGRVVRMVRATIAGRTSDAGPLLVHAAADLTAARGELTRLANILGLLWLGATLLAVAVSAALQRAILRPVERISHALTGIGPERLSQRLPEDLAPRELLPIVGQLNWLLTRVESAFAREKMTIANIAHELRTPVASLRCTLEFALADDRPQIDRPVAERCLAVTLDLQRMITNLLALARIEAGQEQVVLRAVRFAPLLERAWGPLAAEAARRGLTLAGVDQGAALVLRTCPDKARLVLGNLLENAVTYARQGTAIRFSARSADGRAVLVIENDTDHQPPPLERIGTPFVRGDAARTGGDHAGLGLTLVTRLMPHLGGTLRISQPGPGVFRVELDMPVAEAESAVDNPAVQSG